MTPAQVSPATFAHFAHTLMGVAEAAGGRVCAVLEGGYFPLSLAEGAALTLRLQALQCNDNAMTMHFKFQDYSRRSVSLDTHNNNRDAK